MSMKSKSTPVIIGTTGGQAMPAIQPITPPQPQPQPQLQQPQEPQPPPTTLDLIAADPVGAQLYAHDLYVNLVEAHFDCLKLGESTERRNELERIKREAVAKIRRDPQRRQAVERVEKKPETTRFLERHIAVLASLAIDTEETLRAVDRLVADFESDVMQVMGFGASLTAMTENEGRVMRRRLPKNVRDELERQAIDAVMDDDDEMEEEEEDEEELEQQRVKRIGRGNRIMAPLNRALVEGAKAAGLDNHGKAATSPQKASNKPMTGVHAAAQALVAGPPIDTTVPPVSGREDAATLTNRLKRRYAEVIMELKEEFSFRVKKGKLPDDATHLLLNWWTQNFSWPFPSDAEKEDFMKKTQLSQMQISNWFVNRRKRHWHCLFRDNDRPKTPKDALTMLIAMGKVNATGVLLEREVEDDEEEEEEEEEGGKKKRKKTK